MSAGSPIERVEAREAARNRVVLRCSLPGAARETVAQALDDV